MKKMSKKIKLLLVSMILVIGLGGYYLLSGGFGKETMESKLMRMGKDFYENFYYENVTAHKTDEEIEALLSRYKDNGIKINLDNLGRFDSSKYEAEIKSFVNEETKVSCDVNNTRAIIYPYSPYGVTDYEIKTEFDCGFES